MDFEHHEITKKMFLERRKGFVFSSIYGPRLEFICFTKKIPPYSVRVSFLSPLGEAEYLNGITFDSTVPKENEDANNGSP